MAAAHKTFDDDQVIHRMDTPPPAEEDDAEDEATKIGPMARGHIEAMMRKATADENRLSIPKAARLPAIVLVPEPDEHLHTGPPTSLPRPRRSTVGIEIATFAGTFLLVAIPAALAYLHWVL